MIWDFSSVTIIALSCEEKEAYQKEIQSLEIWLKRKSMLRSISFNDQSLS